MSRIATHPAAFDDAQAGALSWISERRFAQDPEQIISYRGAALVAPKAAAPYARRVGYKVILAQDPRLTFAGFALALFPPEPPTVAKGNNVTIGQHTVIGGEGFGYALDDRGRWYRFPHYGDVSIGNNVTIGSNVCIDRGALTDTVIGDGTKVDNLVHIAHGAKIGQDCLIVAQAMIGGSVTIGDAVFVGGGALIKNGVTIGDAATIGLGAVVIRDVPRGVTVVGNPARPL